MAGARSMHAGNRRTDQYHGDAVEGTCGWPDGEWNRRWGRTCRFTRPHRSKGNASSTGYTLRICTQCLAVANNGLAGSICCSLEMSGHDLHRQRRQCMWRSRRELPDPKCVGFSGQNRARYALPQLRNPNCLSPPTFAVPCSWQLPWQASPSTTHL
jgi:hypothetical protein